MPHEHWLVVETREWLQRAWGDLEAARRLLEGPRPLASPAAFHAQQAAEKSLKAFLTFKETAFEKTHDLRELGEQCVAHDQTLADVTDRAAILTRYAIEGRYPGIQSPAPDQAGNALDLAAQVYQAVVSRLPDEAKPADQ
jgi:HEPN domain-containing protein